MCAKRGDRTIESVYDYLRTNSKDFTYGNVDREHNHNLPGLVMTWYKGSGVIEGIHYTYVYCSANMGLPSLDITTETAKDDKAIRDVIHKFGWKGNVKAR